MQTTVQGNIYVARTKGFVPQDEGCIAIMEVWLPGKGEIQVHGQIMKDQDDTFVFTPDKADANDMIVDFTDEQQEEA